MVLGLVDEMGVGFSVWVLGTKGYGLRFREQVHAGLGFRVWSLGLSVECFASSVQVLGFRAGSFL